MIHLFFFHSLSMWIQNTYNLFRGWINNEKKREENQLACICFGCTVGMTSSWMRIQFFFLFPQLRTKLQAITLLFAHLCIYAKWMCVWDVLKILSALYLNNVRVWKIMFTFWTIHLCRVLLNKMKTSHMIPNWIALFLVSIAFITFWCISFSIARK